MVLKQADRGAETLNNTDFLINTRMTRYTQPTLKVILKANIS